VPKEPRHKREDSIKSLLHRWFDENFQRLKFENGHSLSPEVKEAAERQVFLYWNRLRSLAKAITEMEVRLILPGQQTPKARNTRSGRKFNIEGVVDIVSGGGRTIMYDLKTHDPDFIKSHPADYEEQLNVYAHIWRKLRKRQLNETAIIATQFPEALGAAWRNRERDPITFKRELQKWNPIIKIPFKSKGVQQTIKKFGKVVDAIEEGNFSPPSVRQLKRREGDRSSFATRVCRNCDLRFSCTSFRKYVKTSKSRNLPRFREIYEDAGPEPDLHARLDTEVE
jgi:PD-(D/E)XK nuclease superfamily